jgi:biotin transport system substrate-specific component
MNTTNRKTIMTALFSALIIVGAYIRFPLPPVPITLQTMFVLLCAMLGGRKTGTFAVAIYLLLGAIGLPVFTAGGGVGILFGPTGGYLLALLPASYLTGVLADIGYQAGKRKGYTLGCFLGGLAGTLVIYLIGVPFLKYNLSMGWSAAIKAGMLPFLVGDAVKLIVAVTLAGSFSQRVRTFMQPEENE